MDKDMMMGVATKPLAEKTPEKKTKKKVHMRIRQTDNDAFNVEHEEMGAEPQNFAFSKVKDLHAHIEKHYGKGEKKAEPKPAAKPEEKDKKD